MLSRTKDWRQQQQQQRKSSGKRRVLVIEYDVTDLTAKQIDRLMLEAVVQGEASDDGESAAHPDVPVIGTKIIERGGKTS